MNLQKQHTIIQLFNKFLNIKVLILLLNFMLISGGGVINATNKVIKLKSPNERLLLSIQPDDTLSYSLQCENEYLIRNGHIGLELSNGKTLGKCPQLQKLNTKTVTENIVSPHYRCNSFTTSYNEVNLQLKGNAGVITKVLLIGFTPLLKQTS